MDCVAAGTGWHHESHNNKRYRTSSNGTHLPNHHKQPFTRVYQTHKHVFGQTNNAQSLSKLAKACQSLTKLVKACAIPGKPCCSTKLFPSAQARLTRALICVERKRQQPIRRLIPTFDMVACKGYCTFPKDRRALICISG